MRLERFAARVGKGERVVAREAITEYLDRHDPEASQPETLKESEFSQGIARFAEAWREAMSSGDAPPAS